MILNYFVRPRIKTVKKISNSCEVNSLQFLLSKSLWIKINYSLSFLLYSLSRVCNKSKFNDNLLLIEKYIRVPERKKGKRKRKERSKILKLKFRKSESDFIKLSVHAMCVA